MDAAYLGVDLGGTQLRMAAVSAEGRLLTEIFSAPTGRDFSLDDLTRVLAALAQRAQQSLDGRAIAALGFGTAGVVTDGPLTQCDNLPRLNGSPIAALVRSVMPWPVRLENDARCFTLAEARFGAGRGARDVVGITLGTGVGCGVMLDGRLRRGVAVQAGEVWKIPLRGHPVEHFVSGAGVVAGFEAAGGETGLDAAEVEALARSGAAPALAAWRSFGEDLGFLLGCIVALLDPELIVIGGSLAHARDLFQGVLEARLQAPKTRIAGAELGSAAGVIGAAALTIP